MCLREGIARKRLYLPPKFAHQGIRIALGLTVVEKAFRNLLKFSLVAHLVTHHSTQHIGFGQIQTRKIMPDFQNILLINHHAVGFGQKFFQNGMLIIHSIRMMEAVDVFAHHPRLGHARTDDGTGRDQGFVVAATQLAQQSAHRRTFDVKTTAGLGLEQLVANQFVLFQRVNLVNVNA